MKNFYKNLILLLVCAFLISCLAKDLKFNNLNFDSEKWKNSDLRTRGQMVEDLADKNILEGKTKSEVKAILGEPDYINPNTGDWTYKTDKGYRGGSDGNTWIFWFHTDFIKSETVKAAYITD